MNPRLLLDACTDRTAINQRRLTETSVSLKISYLPFVFVGGAGDSRLALPPRPVLRIFDSVYPDEPVLGAERFLQVLQPDVLVSDLGVARPVESRRSSEVQLNGERNTLDVTRAPDRTRFRSREHLHFSEAIVGHLVHQTVEQRRRRGFIHPELSLRREEIALLTTDTNTLVTTL